jgi:hypothetical protein
VAERDKFATWHDERVEFAPEYVGLSLDVAGSCGMEAMRRHVPMDWMVSRSIRYLGTNEEDMIIKRVERLLSMRKL